MFLTIRILIYNDDAYIMEAAFKLDSRMRFLPLAFILVLDFHFMTNQTLAGKKYLG